MNKKVISTSHCLFAQAKWLPPMAKSKCFHKNAANIPTTKTVMKKKIAYVNDLIHRSFQFMASINPCTVLIWLSGSSEGNNIPLELMFGIILKIKCSQKGRPLDGWRDKLIKIAHID
uniref:Uncharacterized protein n=1 Tax=Glossina palpalis gambiensis TaxID=67801 RepID=A0A1B0B683_9MUSC